MLADTHVIRIFGQAGSGQAAELHALAAAVAALPVTAAAPVFGPVGARFLAALADAAATESAAVTALARGVAAGAHTAQGCAAAYTDTELHVARTLTAGIGD